ncbi:MAG: aspartate aminotransferase family protein [Deltaproteobacteria bacterium]|nr:aspartate aminotransferase family protein [Deltaproteobacteria bacterium]
MKLEKETLKILEKALAELEGGFDDLPDFEMPGNFHDMEQVALEVARLMRDNFPYFHPFYAGQMLKPPHPIARLSYMMSMWINPNNHALDGGRASSRLEKEAVAEIAGMFGWEDFLGHLTGGGTMANLEALWVSGKLNPGKTVVASQQAHYTHQRISEVLGLPFKDVDSDAKGKMDLFALEQLLKSGEVGTVVATIGSTGTGSVDPLLEILALKERYGFRLHADAAYGGYFILADNLSPETRAAYDGLNRVDSLVIDPHKHGLQPYGCGCVLFKDPAVGRFYKHESPYTYFSSSELHLGEISLECSRAGASAVALWATQKLLPLVPGGAFARDLAGCRRAALALYEKIERDPRFRPLFAPELDIVVWAPRGDRVSEISNRSESIFQAAAAENLHLATFKYPCRLLDDQWRDIIMDADTITTLRSCLMKPEHETWMDRIWDILDRATEGTLG